MLLHHRRMFFDWLRHRKLYWEQTVRILTCLAGNMMRRDHSFPFGAACIWSNMRESGRGERRPSAPAVVLIAMTSV